MAPGRAARTAVRGPRDAGARPHVDPRARDHRARAPHRRGRPEPRPPQALCLRHRGVDAARLRRAVPALTNARVPPSVTRPLSYDVSDPSVAHRARQRRSQRRRSRCRARQVAVPPERAHRLHLRRHR